MAGSKHPKLLKTAQKDASEMSKSEAAWYEHMKDATDFAKYQIKHFGTLAKSLNKDVNKYFKSMDRYEEKVREISKLEAELKKSPNDKEKSKQLKKAEKDADAALKTVKVDEDNVSTIESEIMEAVGIRKVF